MDRDGKQLSDKVNGTNNTSMIAKGIKIQCFLSIVLVVDVDANWGYVAKIGYPRLLPMLQIFSSFAAILFFAIFHSTILELNARFALSRRFDQ